VSDENLPESTMNVTTAEEVVANEAQRRLLPGFGGRISAALVYDGTDEVRIPDAMGKPRADQMRGTARERLVELSGRLCYDALGKGRNTTDYFEHILHVGHTSITEHASFTVEIKPRDVDPFAVNLLNRPGVWTRVIDEDGDRRVRITLNPRVILDWDDHGQEDGAPAEAHVAEILYRLAEPLTPRILQRVFGSNRGVQPSFDCFGIVDPPWVVEPECDEEKWISLYLVGSRGWGNELVRHRMGAISQRSTRYVDECDSEWVMHPLLAAFQGTSPVHGIATDVRTAIGSFVSDLKRKIDCAGRLPPSGESKDLRDVVTEMEDYASYWTDVTQPAMVAQEAKIAYLTLVRHLQPWLEKRGVDKVSARKQARGAARGLLGLGLETEVIYSASVSTWIHMLTMRAVDAADAEIRLGFAEAALPCLKSSRYGDRFAHLELGPAGDGIGRSLRGGGHR
jgi:thymidylate synthase ThyX